MRKSPTTIQSLLAGAQDQACCTVEGQLGALQKKITKKGQLMALGTLADDNGEASLPLLIFPEQFEAFGDGLEEGRVYRVEGKFQWLGGDPALTAESMELVGD